MPNVLGPRDLVCRPDYMDETVLNTNKQMTKFDLATKQVKVNLGSLFKLTMIDPNPQYYIPSFREIGPPVPEKKLLNCIWVW